jgi:hypothetical protein
MDGSGRAARDQEGWVVSTTAALVKRVDHVMVRVTPEAYDAFFSLLTTTFALPVTWPVNDSIPSFKTGGVFCGNCSLEIFQSGPRQTLPSPAPAQTQLYGVALEPSLPLSETPAELDRRGLAHTPLLPVPPSSPDTLGAMWTLLYLTDLIACDPAAVTSEERSNGDLTPLFDRAYPNGMIFFCEYNRQFYDTTQGRLRLQRELAARGGGPLGLEGVAEIGVGVSDPFAARERWQRLAGPVEAAGPAVWQLGDGPAICLLPDEPDGLRYLTWRVADLHRTRAYLRDRQIPCSEIAGQLQLAPSTTLGLDLRLAG